MNRTLITKPRRIIAAILMLAAVSLGANPQGTFDAGRIAGIAAEATEAAMAAMRNKNASAVSVVLADADGILWQGNFGELERGTGAPVNERTMFGLCSVSKMFVTASVMRLVDRGLVKLDEPVATYVPDFRMEDPRYRKITVRMLLNHSSGLPGMQIMGGMTLGTPYSGYAEHVLRSQALQSLKFEPGTAAVYTNDGFSVLEVLIKRVSGTQYTDFAQREIFDTLGMRDTKHMTARFTEGSFARPDLGGDYSPDAYINMYGTGGLFSSAADLARFGASFLRPDSLLSAASIAAMGEDQTKGFFYPIAEKGNFRYGLGWDTVSQGGMAAVGVKAWQKGGDLGFYGSSLIVLPEEGLVAVVVGATAFGSSDAGTITERLLLRALVERGRLPRMPEPAPWVAAGIAAPDLRERAAISGYYTGMPFSLYRASFDAAGRLTIDAKSGDTWGPAHADLQKRRDGWYSREDYPLSFRFAQNEGTTFFVIRYPAGAFHYLAQIPQAQKIDAGPDMPAAWKSRLGSRWLLSTDLVEVEDSVTPENPVISPRELTELPGYISAQALDGPQFMKAIDSDTAAMWLSIPAVFSRDLKDLRAESVLAAEYLRFGAERYRRADSVPALAPGLTVVPVPAIGDLAKAEPLGTWFRLPVSGSIAVSRAALWRLYDGNFMALASGHGKGSARWSSSAQGAWLVVYPASSEGATLELGE